MPNTSAIPEDLRDFIISRIDSIAEMEALRLLRLDPAAEWDGARLAARLYIDTEEARRVLERLCDHGFLMRSGSAYRYGCASAEIESMVGRVALLYDTQLIPVTHLIHSRPSSRIQKFADAFKLKKGN